MYGDADVPLFGEEGLARFEVGSKVNGVQRLGLTFGHRLVEGAEAGGGIGTRQGDVAHVSQVESHSGEGGETLFVVKVAKAQLVHPHLHRFRQHIVTILHGAFLGVADTNHDGGHIGEVGSTHHGNALSLIKTSYGIRNGDARMRAVTYLYITMLFHRHQRVENDFQTVVFRPDNRGVLAAIPRSKLQRNFILVVVVGKVGTQTDERSYLTFGNSIVLVNFLSMDEHSEFLELAQIVTGGLIDSPCIAIAQVLHFHGECLLVDMVGGCASVALLALDARRQHVGYRITVSILLNTQR